MVSQLHIYLSGKKEVFIRSFNNWLKHNTRSIGNSANIPYPQNKLQRVEYCKSNYRKISRNL